MSYSLICQCSEFTIANATPMIVGPGGEETTIITNASTTKNEEGFLWKRKWENVLVQVALS